MSEKKKIGALSRNKASDEVRPLSTAENIALLKSMIDCKFKDKAGEILDLLNKRPSRDEIIIHFLKTDPYRSLKNSQELVGIFYTKEESPDAPREEYYSAIYKGACARLEKWIVDSTQHVYSKDMVFNNLHLVFQKTTKNKHVFLRKLQTFCTKLLDMNDPFADEVIYHMIACFGEKRERGEYNWLPEFSFTAATECIKRRTNDTPFKEVKNCASDKRKLFYNSKKKKVMFSEVV